MKSKLGLTKNWGFQNGGFSPNEALKILNFLTFSSHRHEIFKITKHKEKILFSKIWGYQNGSALQTRPPKFYLTFKSLELDGSNFQFR